MDSRLTCQRIVVILIFLTVCQSRELDIFYFSSYLNETAFETLLSLSLSQCVTACKTRTRCASVNYAKTGKTCELLDYSYNGCTTSGLYDGSFSTAVIDKRFVHGCKTEWNMTLYDACSICKDSEVCNILPDNMVTCHITYCDFPPSLSNAEILGNFYTVGSKICYRCRDGFLSVGGDVSCTTCLSDGTWTQLTIQCEAPVFCDTGWVEYEHHCYIQNPTTMKWSDAQSYCENLGGYLLSIESSQEQMAMQGIFPSGDFWLGGNDLDSESTWVWVSGVPLTYTFWDDNEPNSYYPLSDCLHCRATTWKWHDYRCEAQYKSICEKDA